MTLAAGAIAGPMLHNFFSARTSATEMAVWMALLPEPFSPVMKLTYGLKRRRAKLVSESQNLHSSSCTDSCVAHLSSTMRFL